MSDLPPDWEAGDVVPADQTYSAPPDQNDDSRVRFYGLHGDGTSHRLYSVPTSTSITDIVRYFEVGSHGVDEVELQGRSERVSSVIEHVAAKAEEIAEIIPCHVIFADAAGLKLRFEHQITPEELEELEELFEDEEDQFGEGMEYYLAAFDPEKTFLAPVLEENLFHFWWD